MAHHNVRFSDTEKIAMVRAYAARGDETMQQFMDRVGLGSSGSLTQWRQAIREGRLTAPTAEVESLVARFLGHETTDSEGHDGHTIVIGPSRVVEEPPASNGMGDFETAQKVIGRLFGKVKKAEKDRQTVLRKLHRADQAVIDAKKEVAEALAGIQEGLAGITSGEG